MTKENKKEKNRAPIVVIMGHVDHGKSSILESIKDLKITSKESGGITQHIGAYEIEHNKEKITFIDTPGHEAFFLMRERGAKIADIAILVVASDEGVKKQTEEAINHIVEAKIPFLVAINKIDKTNSNPEKVKLGLAEKNVLVEDLGGKIPSVNVSAITKKGIPDLLDMILLIAEMEELKKETDCRAEGVVIESHLDQRRGPVSSIIITKGVLRVGDSIWSSSCCGKIKIIEDFMGNRIKEAHPSMPVVILGLPKIPHTGENIKAIKEGEKMEEVIQKECLFSCFKGEEGKKCLNLIIKADVLGSLEAIESILKKIPTDKVVIKIIKAEVGNIDEGDIKLAKSTDSKVIGFRVKTSNIARDFSFREKIKIMSFDIIYELEDAVRNFLSKIIEPEIVKKEIGKVKILEIFKSDKSSKVIGGKVIYGEIRKGVTCKIFRNEEEIGEGKITGLQHDKKNVGEVLKGSECGMLFQTDIEVERGDILTGIIEEKIKGEL